MINDSAGGTMNEQDNKPMENIDVVDVETGTTTGKRKASSVGCRGPNERHWRINASLMCGRQ
jgi:hypothetical protein